MSQLQMIQDELRKRMAQPSQSTDERDPSGYPRGWIGNMDPATGAIWENPPPRTDEPRRRMAQPTGDVNAPPVNAQQAALATPVRGPIASEAAVPKNPTLPAPRTQPSPFAPPEPQPPGPVQVDTSAIGAPPPPTVTADPRTGEPKREAYFTKNNPQAAVEYRDAMEQWKPHGHRGFKGTLKEAGIGALAGIASNPQNPIAGAVGGGITGTVAGLARPGYMTRGFKLNRADADVQKGLTEDRARAQTEALRLKPGQAQDAEQSRAMARYNQLEDYDPTDPTNAGLKQYFESRGLLGLPARSKYHRATVTRTGDGRVLVTDQNGTRDMAVDNQVVTDRSRTLNDQGLTANQAAGIGQQEANRTSRESEGKLNRQARADNVQAIIKAASGRQSTELKAIASRMGDPQEMFAAAAEVWDLAQDKKRQAESESDYGKREQLRKEAGELEQKTITIQEEARKARSGQGGVASQPTTNPSKAGTWSAKRFSEAFKAKHGRVPSQAEIDAYSKAAQ